MGDLRSGVPFCSRATQYDELSDGENTDSKNRPPSRDTIPDPPFVTLRKTYEEVLCSHAQTCRIRGPEAGLSPQLQRMGIGSLQGNSAHTKKSGTIRHTGSDLQIGNKSLSENDFGSQKSLSNAKIPEPGLPDLWDTETISCFKKEEKGRKELFHANFSNASANEKPSEIRSYHNTGSDIHHSKQSYSNLGGLTPVWDIYHSDQRTSDLVPLTASCDGTNGMHQLHLSPLTVRAYGANLKLPLEPSVKDSDSHKNTGKFYTSSVHFEVKPISVVTLDLSNQLGKISDDMQTTMEKQPKSFSNGDVVDKHLQRLGKCPFSLSTTAVSNATSAGNIERIVPRIVNDSSDGKLECKDSVIKNVLNFDEKLVFGAKLLRRSELTAKSYMNTGDNSWVGEKADEVEYFGKMISLRVGQVNEAMQLLSPPLSPIPSESAEKLTASLQPCMTSRAIDLSPSILQQKYIVLQAPLNLTSQYIALDDESSNGNDAYSDMPPARSAVPESPYVPEVIFYQGISSKSLIKFLSGKKDVTHSANQISSPLRPKEEDNPTAQETLERINKLRRILRAEEGNHSLEMDKSVQAGQPLKKKSMISRAVETEEPKTDPWDTATVSDSLADSSSHYEVENYDRSGKLAPQNSRSEECSQFKHTLKDQKLPPKFGRSRRRPKQTNAKVTERLNSDLTSGAPFMVGRLGRSNAVGGQCRNSPGALPEAPMIVASRRWEDCINKLYARCRQNSASAHPRVLLEQKRTLRNACCNERRSNRQVRSSVLQQTFSSAQRCKLSQRSLPADIFVSR
ncbi:hypothetical protein Aperf_G00000125515 [Anoplocephala perfoliata]